MESLLQAPSQVGQLLRAGRRSQKLSQHELASRVGISQPNLSKMEQGHASVTIEQFLTLCANLNLEVVVRTKDSLNPSPTETEVEW